MTTIGKVSATEKSPTSADDFTFWLDDAQVVAPFDLVAAPNASGSTTVGVIREIHHATDSPSHIANYVSSDFGDVTLEATTPRFGTTYASVGVMNNDREVYMPLRDGAPVRFATEEEIRQALGIDGIPEERRVPAGFLRQSNQLTVPVFLDSGFLLGPEGAHLNISGISGLATKTSYAMFLLQAITQGAEPERMATIIFNVKGDDLLYIDKPASDLPDTVKQEWSDCGLEAKPFQEVRYFFPYTNDDSRGYANTSCDRSRVRELLQSGRADNYIYTYKEDRDKLDLLMSNVDDVNFTLDSIRNAIMTEASFDRLSDWRELMGELTTRCRARQGDTIQIQSWRRFKRLLNTIVNSESGGVFQDSKSGNADKRQIHLSEELAKLEGGKTYVVDIAGIPEQQKCLVFGDAMRSVNRLKTEGDGDCPDRIVVFVDELNKYAPTSVKSSPIIGDLLEITERGRYLGIVLFAAEQFRSAIHSRVKGNCATNVYGRTNGVEVGTTEYKFLPKSFTGMMTRLQKGHLIIQHPIFRSLIKIAFPRPSYHQPTH